MRRFILITTLAAIATFAYLRTGSVAGNVTVLGAQAMPMGASANMFMVTLDMKNDGPAVTLTSVASPNGADASLMNPQANSAPLVIPGNGTGILAMDGAHIMLRMPDGSFEEGAFQPLTLAFDDESTVVARVIRAPGGPMQHDMTSLVEVDPAPRITILPLKVAPEGFAVKVMVENFEFVVAADGASHVAGQGHAHMYLNGLKLGRLYEDRFDMGALKPGEYSLRVTLNSNDHRAYATEGVPAESVWTFRIP